MLGALKTRQPLAALDRLGPGPQDERRHDRSVMPPAPGPVELELDLRGYRAAEIEPMLDEYLEQAYRSGMPFVRIIHGKGTGALRKVVTRRALPSTPPSPATKALRRIKAATGRRWRSARGLERPLTPCLR